MSEIRVLIVEDEPLIAADIAACIQKYDYLVTGISYTTEQAEKELATNLPDVIFLDINLKKGEEGIRLAEKINEHYKIPFIYLTSYSDRQTLNAAKTTRPCGYVVKPFSCGGLYAALEVALYNYAQQNKIIFPQLRLQTINEALASPLSEREFEVLQLIYEGYTNIQIADKIFVSSNTIKNN